MSIRRKGLVAAMEDESSVGIELGEGVDAGAADAMQADQAVQDSHDEIEEVQAAIEDAEEGAEDLEAIGDVAADTIEEGGEGMSEDAARVTEVAVESICRRLGVRGSSIVPATESFGSRSSRITATRITVEGIVETVKKIWAAIIAGFKKIWAKLVDFYKYLTDSNVRMEARAKALIEKATKGSSTIETTEFENQAIANAFHEKGDFKVARVVSAMANIKEELGEAKVAAEKVVTVMEAISNSKTTKEVGDALINLSAAQNTAEADLAKTMGLEGDEASSLKASKELLSGSYIATYGEEIVDGDKSYMLVVTKAVTTAEEDEEVSEKVETCSKSDAIKICNAVITVCKAVKASEGVSKVFDKADKAIEKAAKNVATLAAGEVKTAKGSKDDLESAKEAAASIKKTIVSLGEAIRVYASFPQKEASKGGNLALNYVATSIGNWKSGK
jgi:hypothetical protein